MKIADFDVVNIIKNNTTLKYEVIHRTNTKKYYLQVINYKTVSKKVKKGIISDYKKIQVWNRNNNLRYFLGVENVLKDSDLKLIYIVQTFYPGTNLSELFVNLKNGPKFNEDFVWKMCYQCCDALKSMEEFCSIAKFKSLNVFLSKDCVYFDSEWNVKLDLFHTRAGNYFQNLANIIFEMLTFDDSAEFSKLKGNDFYEFLIHLINSPTMQNVMLNPTFIKRTICLENKIIPIFRTCPKEKRRYFKKVPTEDLNTTFSAASCDTTIIQTSTRINTAKYEKPKFQRSQSERRKRITKERGELQNLQLVEQKLKQLHVSNLNKAQSTSHESLFGCKKRADRVSYRPSSSSGSSSTSQPPFSWTRESKKHAFELLRMMNDKENINATYKLPGNCQRELKTTYF